MQIGKTTAKTFAAFSVKFLNAEQALWLSRWTQTGLSPTDAAAKKKKQIQQRTWEREWDYDTTWLLPEPLSTRLQSLRRLVKLATYHVLKLKKIEIEERFPSYFKSQPHEILSKWIFAVIPHAEL